MIGFLIYLPTLAFMPHSLYLLAIIYSFFRYRSLTFNNTNDLTFLNKTLDISIIALIVMLSILNYFIGHGLSGISSGKVPSFLLLPFTYLIALLLDKRDIHIIITLTLIECLAVFAEYLYGVSTFFSSLERYNEIGSSDLIYYNKPLGLSYNSSIVAAKLFLAFLLLDLVKIKTPLKVIFQLSILACIFLTFNRTVFLSIGIYIVLKNILKFLSSRFTIIKWSVYLNIGIVILITLALFSALFWEEILNQLTRKTGIVELSGRDRIWAHYFEFANNNFLLGNHSFKYYFGEYHAHNSFLQLLTTNGILISLIYIYLIVRNINIGNFVYVIAIFSYCFFQYGIFWGISLMDILFFYILIHIKELVIQNNGMLISQAIPKN